VSSKVVNAVQPGQAEVPHKEAYSSQFSHWYLALGTTEFFNFAHWFSTFKGQKETGSVFVFWCRDGGGGAPTQIGSLGKTNLQVFKLGCLHPVACTGSGSGFPSNSTLFQ
jgi:hypothetical protein